MRLLFRQLILVNFLLLSASLAQGQEAPPVDRLSEINARVTALQDEQKKISADISLSEKASAQLTKEIEAVQSQIDSSGKRLAELSTSSQSLDEEIKDFDLRYDALSSQSRLRLRSLYMLGGGQQMALKVADEGRMGLSRIAHYMGTLRKYEIATLAEMRRLSSERQLRVQELSRQTNELQDLQRQSLKSRELLVAKNRQLQSTKDNLKRQKLNKTRNISELRSEALRLETALSSLEVDPPSPEVTSPEGLRPPPPLSTIEDPASTSPNQPQVAEDGTQEGLGTTFPSPVEGLLVVRFGANVPDGTGQVVKSKGLGFTGTPGDSVLAVGTGKASFVGVLGTYGNVVILDHGQRTFTLYSQLDSIAVTSGQMVQTGAVLGQLGKITLPKPYNFYFELRKEGKAVDPKPFLNGKS